MRDLVKAAMLGALRGLDEELEQQGWDQPASLWVIQRDLFVDGFGLLFSPLLGGHVFGGSKHPSDTLADIADEAAHRKPPVPDNAFAFAFICEGWSVDRMEADGLDELVEARKLHTHPARQEVRMLSAVDVAGFHYGLNRFRESGIILESAARPSEAKEQEELFVTGYVHESLQRLVTACI